MNRLTFYAFMIFGYIAGQLNGHHWYSVLFFIAGMLISWLVFTGADKMTDRFHK